MFPTTPYFYTCALANVFVYLLRYGVLVWAPTYLKEAKHGRDGGFVLLVSACLLAMAFLAPTLWHKNVASSSREEVLA